MPIVTLEQPPTLKRVRVTLNADEVAAAIPKLCQLLGVSADVANQNLRRADVTFITAKDGARSAVVNVTIED